MAVEPKICVEGDLDSLYVYDVTGVKSSDNPNGWGPSNKSFTDIDSAVLEIWRPGDSDPVEVDPYPSLPNDSGVGWEVPKEDLLLGSIKSGVYRVRVTYRDEDDTLEDGSVWEKVHNYYYLSKVALECCLRDKGRSTDVLDDKKERDKYWELTMLFDTMMWNACYGQMSQAQRIAEYLNLQCRC